MKNTELNEAYHRYLESTHFDSKGLEENFNRKIHELQLDHQRAMRQQQEDYAFKMRDITNKTAHL